MPSTSSGSASEREGKRQRLLHLLTVDPNWPTRRVAGCARPDLLVLP